MYGAEVASGFASFCEVKGPSQDRSWAATSPWNMGYPMDDRWIPVFCLAWRGSKERGQSTLMFWVHSDDEIRMGEAPITPIIFYGIARKR